MPRKRAWEGRMWVARILMRSKGRNQKRKREEEGMRGRGCLPPPLAALPCAAAAANRQIPEEGAAGPGAAA